VLIRILLALFINNIKLKYVGTHELSFEKVEFEFAATHKKRVKEIFQLYERIKYCLSQTKHKLLCVMWLHDLYNSHQESVVNQKSSYQDYP